MIFNAGTPTHLQHWPKKAVAWGDEQSGDLCQHVIFCVVCTDLFDKCERFTDSVTKSKIHLIIDFIYTMVSWSLLWPPSSASKDWSWYWHHQAVHHEKWLQIFLMRCVQMWEKLLWWSGLHQGEQCAPCTLKIICQGKILPYFWNYFIWPSIGSHFISFSPLIGIELACKLLHGHVIVTCIIISKPNQPRILQLIDKFKRRRLAYLW